MSIICNNEVFDLIIRFPSTIGVAGGSSFSIIVSLRFCFKGNVSFFRHETDTIEHLEFNRNFYL